MKRRSFIAGASSSILMLATDHASAYSLFGRKEVSPSDRIRVGLIGCGNMGWANLVGFMAFPQVTCTGLCDVDQQLMERRAQELAVNHDLKVNTYSDYRHLLDAKDVDAVIIATPDHWHCLQFTDACRAGKDVYLEKPIANSIAECELMEEVADAHGTVVQVGQQQRSSTMWKNLIDYVQSGVLGNIGHISAWANFNYAALKDKVPDAPIPQGVNYDRWLGPAPQRPFNRQRFHGSWRMFWDYGGGLLTDWGVHLLDMVIWARRDDALPVKTQAMGGNLLFPNGGHETYDTMRVNYQLAGSLLSWEHNAGIQTGPYGKNYGICFRGENGTAVANRESWSIFAEGGRVPERTETPANPEHAAHIANFLESVKTRDRETNCPIRVGATCAKYAHLGNISARMGGTSLWYDERQKTLGEAQADLLLKPRYRSPWKLDS